MWLWLEECSWYNVFGIGCIKSERRIPVVVAVGCVFHEKNSAEGFCETVNYGYSLDDVVRILGRVVLVLLFFVCLK